MPRKICIIGLGEIGTATLEDMMAITKSEKLDFNFY